MMPGRSRRRRRIVPAGFALLLIGFALAAAGCKEKSQPPLPVWKSGTTIIPGTFGWNAETGTIVPPDNADLWWEMVAETECYLTPCNSARAALVKHRTYEELTGRHLERWHMPEERIPGFGQSDALAQGAVIALRTAEGNLGKLQVVGFRPLHDLSFPEASVYTEQWKTQAATRPDHERYHIEIKWTLYQSPGDM
jgi:hypothetical protein